MAKDGEWEVGFVGCCSTPQTDSAYELGSNDTQLIYKNHYTMEGA
jgi:hypothetical protein